MNPLKAANNALQYVEVDSDQEEESTP